MSKKPIDLKKVMSELLNQRLPAQEVASLNDEGFILNKPTRKAAVMIALYKKAVSGDLSAIKELRSIVSSDEKLENEGVVNIIEDI